MHTRTCSQPKMKNLLCFKFWEICFKSIWILNLWKITSLLFWILTHKNQGLCWELLKNQGCSLHIQRVSGLQRNSLIFLTTKPKTLSRNITMSFKKLKIKLGTVLLFLKHWKLALKISFGSLRRIKRHVWSNTQLLKNLTCFRWSNLPWSLICWRAFLKWKFKLTKCKQCRVCPKAHLSIKWCRMHFWRQTSRALMLYTELIQYLAVDSISVLLATKMLKFKTFRKYTTLLFLTNSKVNCKDNLRNTKVWR